MDASTMGSLASKLKIESGFRMTVTMDTKHSRDEAKRRRSASRGCTDGAIDTVDETTKFVEYVDCDECYRLAD